MKRIIKKYNKNIKSSYIIKDKIIKDYIMMDSFPFLISFPRTGSHWVRMIMELYFTKPSLVRVFFNTNPESFTCYHTHDLKYDVIRKNVLYLYRNPTDTIYSLMTYHNENMNNIYRVKYWSALYGLHLSKWLIDENFTSKKIIIKYEKLKENIYDEFDKICSFFGEDMNYEKLEYARNNVTKSKLQNIVNDERVVKDTSEYHNNRQLFYHEYNQMCINTILNQNKNLKKYIND